MSDIFKPSDVSSFGKIVQRKNKKQSSWISNLETNPELAKIKIGLEKNKIKIF